MRYVPYKTLTGWATVKEDEVTKENGRIVLKLVLGEKYEDKGKEIVGYIVEDIYKDILTDIDLKSYSISVKPGKTPQLIIVKDGRLVIHNKSILECRKYVLEKLADVPKEILLSAYLNMRLNSEMPKKLSASTHALVSLINTDNDTSYTVPFIWSVLCDYIEEEYYNTSEKELEEYIRSLEYEEILSLLNDVIMLKNGLKPKDEYIEELLQEKLDIEHLETVVNKEIAFRLYKGSLEKR